MITFEQIKNNEDIRTYIRKADEALSAIGYTEHCFAHVTKVAHDAGYIMSMTGADEHTVELTKIAGFMHDIGNLVNRVDHSQSGAVMAFQILTSLGADSNDVSEIVRAIGNHDEGTGIPVSKIAAALILADKCDVRRSRVRSGNIDKNDIHDRVNFSVAESKLSIDNEKGEIILKLEIDDTISPVMDYFEIFLGRMKLCKSAAETLGLRFRLIINSQTII